jgi:hypothetical protein
LFGIEDDFQGAQTFILGVVKGLGKISIILEGAFEIVMVLKT